MEIKKKYKSQNEEDFIDLFTKLPDEVLEEILVFLTDTKDQANIAAASWVCERLLEPTKTYWLFHKVLPVLVKCSPTLLNLKEILNLRLVCKEWKRSINAFLRETSLATSIPQVQACKFHASTSTAIADFISTMSYHLGTGLNPFVGRRIYLGKLYSREIDPVYWSNVLNLLRLFGIHIWECTLEVEDNEVNFMFLLHGILRRLPNLKLLRVYHTDWGIGTYRQQRINNLIQYYERHPLPDLPHLEHLSVRGAPSQFFYLVLPKYIGGLKSLALECYLPLDFQPHSKTVFSRGENLTFLKISVLDCDDFRDLFSTGSQLETLILDLSSVRNVDFEMVLKLISRLYGKTLKILQIEYGADVKICENEVSSLANQLFPLKTFKMKKS